MTAAERLVALAGHGGTASALLLAIGSGATAGAALVNYSGMSSATAAEHLLAEHNTIRRDYGLPKRRAEDEDMVAFIMAAMPIINRRSRRQSAVTLLADFGDGARRPS